MRGTVIIRDTGHVLGVIWDGPRVYTQIFMAFNFGKDHFRQFPPFHCLTPGLCFSDFVDPEFCLGVIFIKILRSCEFLEAAISFLALFGSRCT